MRPILLRKLSLPPLLLTRCLGSEITANTASKPKWAKVYTAAQVQTKLGREYAGYGIRWLDNVFPDRTARFTQLPITLTRAHMQAIISALQLAVHYELEQLEIVTESGIFVSHHRRGWVKKDGNPVANAPLYAIIKGLEEKLEVKFLYMPTANTDYNMRLAKQLAVDGMAYPSMPFELDMEAKGKTEVERKMSSGMTGSEPEMSPAAIIDEKTAMA